MQIPGLFPLKSLYVDGDLIESTSDFKSMFLFPKIL